MKLFPTPSSYECLSIKYGDFYKWWLLITVGIGTVAGVLSTSSFNVAVAALSHDFGLTQERVQWAMTGFMAAMTLSMLPAPWLLERIGFRRVFLSAVLILMLASLAGCFASSFGFLVTVRVLQGTATGVLQPLCMLMVMRLFPADSQGRASGILVLGLAATPAVAPAFGGMLIDQFGWQAIFLLNLPFCLIALVAGVLLLPLPREIKRQRFDWAGAFLLSTATFLIVEGVSSLQHSGLLSLWTIGHFMVVGILVTLFVRHARHTRFPIVSLGLFRHRTFTMGVLTAFAYGFGLYGSTYLIPVFLQSALKYSSTAAGSALIPGGLALVIATPIAGRLADVYSPKIITVIGLFLFGVSFLIFAGLGGGITYTQLLAVTVAGRIGLGLILPALNLATLRHLEPHHLAQSSVVVSYMRQLGGVLGIAVIAAFLGWRETIHGTTPPGIYTVYSQAFILLGISLLAAVISAYFMQDRKQVVME